MANPIIEELSMVIATLTLERNQAQQNLKLMAERIEGLEKELASQLDRLNASATAKTDGSSGSAPEKTSSPGTSGAEPKEHVEKKKARSHPSAK